MIARLSIALFSPGCHLMFEPGILHAKVLQRFTPELAYVWWTKT
jgi:hypothetical protein